MKGTLSHKNNRSEKLSFNLIRDFMVFIILFYHLSSICQTVTDIDNNKYTTIKMGDQIWMSQNLNVTHFKNGDVIPEVINQREWQEAWINKKPAWCNPNNINNLTSTYGKLYNWHAVKNSRILAPSGYHIPSDLEWSLLTEYLGGEEIAGFKMKSTSGWANGGNGDNSSLFNGLPGGYCYNNGNFYNMTENGYWWSSSESNTNLAWSRNLYKYNTKVGRFNDYKKYGFSVRCLRD